MFPEIPQEQLPVEETQDIQFVNQMIWHGLQAFHQKQGVKPVQPLLNLTEITPGAPVDIAIHPDGTFPRGRNDPPWGFQLTRVMYPSGSFHYEATQTTITKAMVEGLPDIEQKMGQVGLLPQVIIELDANTALHMKRPDLDDAERRYLQKTQYIFRKDRLARRQDVFNTGGEESHIVVNQPPAQELRILHREVHYSDASCACQYYTLLKPGNEQNKKSSWLGFKQ